MKVSIKSNPQAKRLTITLSEVDFEKMALENFYQSEKRVQQIVNHIGKELTREILQSHDIDDKTIERDGQTWYRKEASTGHYQTLYGEVIVSRHLYQTSAGGVTRCPMEEACGLSFGAATPLLAETLSFKVSALTPGEVAKDLTKHGLQLSPSFIREVAQQVGQIAVEKAVTWKLETPSPQAPVEIVATGLDGTTAPIRGEDYKEAMCGTVALYERAWRTALDRVSGRDAGGRESRFHQTFHCASRPSFGALPESAARRLERRRALELATDQRTLSSGHLDSRFLARGAASFTGCRRDLRTSAGRGKVSLVRAMEDRPKR
jgi:hypothetical protein